MPANRSPRLSGVYDLEGNEYSSRQITSPTMDGSSKWFNHARKLISEAIQMNASGRVIAIGLAAPSLLGLEKINSRRADEGVRTSVLHRG